MKLTSSDSNIEELMIYTKADNITISSLKIAGHRKKLVKPVPQGRYWGVHQMYVNPCPIHDEESPTIPVDTYSFDQATQGGVFLGRRRYCVMCWTWVDAESLRTDFEAEKIVPDKGDVVKPLDIEV